MNHSLHDLRSLEMHRLICAQLRVSPALIERARAVCQHWRGQAVSARDDPSLEIWQRLLQSDDIDELERRILDPGDQGQQLRQSSPLSVLLKPKDRWLFLKQWKALHAP